MWHINIIIKNSEIISIEIMTLNISNTLVGNMLPLSEIIFLSLGRKPINMWRGNSLPFSVVIHHAGLPLVS